MTSKPRLLFSIPTRHHVEIALDELQGMQELGYECKSFPYAAKEGKSTPLGRFKVIFENAFNLLKICRSFRPDIIYFNSRLEILAGTRDRITISLIRLLYNRPVKIIIKSHGSDIEILQSRKLFPRLLLPFFKSIDAWLFLSLEEKESVKQTGLINPEKIFTTQNIVRIGQFRKSGNFKETHKIPSDNICLLFVGRIIREKGPFEVVEAFSRLNNQGLTLIIVGDGPDFSELESLIVNLNLTTKVILTGFIPESDVTNYYSNADILVFPTYFPEGFPMALFNSVAAGLGVVTTPIRAAKDFLEEPENCLWVKPKDSISVKNALEQLLNNRALMDTLKANNLEKARLFSKEEVCKKLAKIIDKVNQ